MVKRTIMGIISDTHGLVRPEVLESLQGSAFIIHAGDIGRSDVLEALRMIAPVHAVRGHNDKEPWAQDIPVTENLDVGAHVFYVLHQLDHLDLDPCTSGFSAVTYGHSHKPVVETQKGVLYLNPGSVGPRGFNLPISMARLYVCGNEIEHEIIELNV